MPLTSEQFNNLVEQYAEIVLDRMDIGTMEQWIFDELCDRYNDMSETELRDYMVEIEDSGCPEDCLFDQLADNVSNDTVVDPKDYSWGLQDS